MAFNIDIPRRWRQEPAPDARAPLGYSSRQRRIYVLAAAILFVAGATAGLLRWLAAAPSLHFVPLWVNEYRSPLVPVCPAAERDRRAILRGAYFKQCGISAVGSLERHQILQELARLDSLSRGESAVIYLSAYATRGQAGNVCLMPADYVPGDASTLLPLAELLAAVRRCPAGRKLLVLDLMRPVADWQLDILTNDAAFLVAQELKQVEDADLLVLCASTAWQTSLASDELGGTVFGHYFEQGLRGYADGWGPTGQRNGRVCVHELASYLSQRVDSWAWSNLHQRQSPWLAGSGPDFELVALPHGRPLPPEMPTTEFGYPQWLRDGWKLRDAWLADRGLTYTPRQLTQLEHALLLAEHAWSLGEDAQTLARDLKSRTEALAGRRDAALLAVAGPAPTSLAQCARNGLVADPKLATALSDFLAKLSAQTAGLQAAPALAVKQKLISQLQEQVKAAPPAELALAVCNQLAAETNPQPDLVRLLDNLLAAHQPHPLFAETALLARLARLADNLPASAWPAGKVRQTVQVMRQGEQAASYCRGLSAAESLLERASVQRHVAETVLFNPCYASLADADSSLKTASTLYDEATGRMETIDQAGHLLEEAIWLAVGMSPILDSDETLEPAWLATVADAERLAAALEIHPKTAFSQGALESIRQHTTALRLQMEPVQSTCNAKEVQRLVSRLARSDAGPPAIQCANRLLDTPCLMADDRVALWLARRRAAVRLALRTHNREMLAAPHAAASELEAYSPQSNQVLEQSRALAREKVAAMMLKLAGLTTAAKDRIPATAIEQQLANSQSLTLRDRLARVYPAQAPCEVLDQAATNPTSLLRKEEAVQSWRWLASWYRYLSHDCGEETFFAEAATEYLSRCGALTETWVEFDSPQLLPARHSRDALTINVPWRVAGPHATGIKLHSTLLMPESSPWNATLEAQTLACTDPLRVQVLSASVSSAAAMPPRGCLLQVQYGQRVYHLPISLSNLGGIHQWDVVVSANPQAPEPALNALRLRPLLGWQPYHLYLHNRSAQPRSVIVRLGAASSAKTVVTPGSRTKITFAGEPPKEHTELPQLDGPLVAHVVDAESGEQLADEIIPIGVASPREYLAIPAIQFQPAGLKPNRLSLTAQTLPQFVGPPCRVELILPPERIAGLAGTKGGMLQGVLKQPGQSIELFADGLRLADESPREGSVYVNVDDCPRAFEFHAAFPRDGEATIPYEDPQPALRLIAAPLARSGPNVTALMEVDQGPQDATLLVELGSRNHGLFTPERVQKFTTPRNQRVGFSAVSADGSLLLSAAVRDWQAHLDCSGIIGHRLIRARLMAADGQTLCTAEQPITLDDSSPQSVQLVDPPSQAAKGTSLALVARGADDLSGIASAAFFFGRPVDGKLPAPAAVAKPSTSDPSQWTAALDLPPDAKGPIVIGVQMTNGVGLSTIATTTVEVLDGATLSQGKITGSVLEGPRPQAGLEVVLKDEKGTELARTKTGEDGTFVFDKLAPGKYTIGSSKPTALRKAETSVSVEAGKVATATLTLAI